MASKSMKRPGKIIQNKPMSPKELKYTSNLP